MPIYLYKYTYLVFVFLIASCSSDKEPVNRLKQLDKLHEAQRFSLEFVLTYPKPLDLYQKTYRSFQLSSNSSFIRQEEESHTQIEGRSLLEMDENGNFHLVRIPLYKTEPTELFLVNQKAYLRKNDEKGFYALRIQDEFLRWLQLPFQEIFELYKKNGFLTEEPPVKESSFHCWTKPHGKICVDTNTGLPIRGILQSELNEKDSLKVQFGVVVGQSELVGAEFIIEKDKDNIEKEKQKGE